MSKVHGGLAAVRFTKAIFNGSGSVSAARAYAEAQNWKDTPEVATVLRSAVSAISTGTASALVNDIGPSFSEFIRPATLLGRIRGLREVPLRVRMIVGTGGSTAYWVGEGRPKPISAAAFGNLNLDPLKVVGIVVVTQELLTNSSPKADVTMQNDLRAAVVAAADTAFIDPANAGIPDVTPPSITSGVAPIPSSGSDIDAIQTDLKEAVAQLVAAGSSLANAAWIMSPETAVALNLKGFDSGFTVGINAKGGELAGLPVYTSEHVPSDTSGSLIVLVDVSQIALGDEDGVALDVVKQASVQMSDTPEQGQTAMVSLWQTNCAAVRVERYMNWRLLRPMVAVISGVRY